MLSAPLEVISSLVSIITNPQSSSIAYPVLRPGLCVLHGGHRHKPDGVVESLRLHTQASHTNQDSPSSRRSMRIAHFLFEKGRKRKLVEEVVTES